MHAKVPCQPDPFRSARGMQPEQFNAEVIPRHTGDKEDSVQVPEGTTGGRTRKEWVMATSGPNNNDFVLLLSNDDQV